MKSSKIVTIGGGTGHFTLLQELKKLTPNITAIVNMSDDGGSTGTLRDELGVLPPGDIRQCLVALSDSPEMRDVFNYRFSQGSLANQSLGNVILSGLELKYGDFEKAIEVASSILRINGRVVPITLDNHTLVLHDGQTIIRNERIIDDYRIKNRTGVFIEQDPAAEINPAAREALEQADLIVVAPGSLYGSLLSVLVTRGVAEALKASKAKKVLVANLVNKPGQTDNWHVVDYVKAVCNCIGYDFIDVVLYNNQMPPPELLKKYATGGELPVDFSADRFSGFKATFIGSPLVSEKIHLPKANATAVRRAYIRHDAEKVCRLLSDILS